MRWLLGLHPAARLDDIEKLIVENRIFRDRTEGVGTISRRTRVDWGWTGPCLRASGVAYDVRKAHPYLATRRSTSRSRSRTAGDIYARFLVRMEEIRQSLSIIEQALDAAHARARSSSTTPTSRCRRRSRSTTRWSR